MLHRRCRAWSGAAAGAASWLVLLLGLQELAVLLLLLLAWAVPVLALCLLLVLRAWLMPRHVLLLLPPPHLLHSLPLTAAPLRAMAGTVALVVLLVVLLAAAAAAAPPAALACATSATRPGPSRSLSPAGRLPSTSSRPGRSSASCSAAGGASTYAFAVAAGLLLGWLALHTAASTSSASPCRADHAEEPVAARAVAVAVRQLASCLGAAQQAAGSGPLWIHTRCRWWGAEMPLSSHTPTPRHVTAPWG